MKLSYLGGGEAGNYLARHLIQAGRHDFPKYLPTARTMRTLIFRLRCQLVNGLVDAPVGVGKPSPPTSVARLAPRLQASSKPLSLLA